MARNLLLEDFAPAPQTVLASARSEGLAEEQRLIAFEQGYQAGWDDAIAASDEDQSRVTADLASQLRDLSFGFHEARAHVLSGVEELITSVMQSLVPRIGSEVLPLLVVEHLTELVQGASNTPVKLRVAPANRSAIEAALPSEPGFPLSIEDSEDCAVGQVGFVMGRTESELNLDECFARIEEEVTKFFSENERQLANG